MWETNCDLPRGGVRFLRLKCTRQINCNQPVGSSGTSRHELQGLARVGVLSEGRTDETRVFSSPNKQQVWSLLPRLLQKVPHAYTFFRFFFKHHRLLPTFSPSVYATLLAFSSLCCLKFAKALIITTSLANRRLNPTQIVSTHRHPHILNDLPPPAEFIR